MCGEMSQIFYDGGRGESYRSLFLFDLFLFLFHVSADKSFKRLFCPWFVVYSESIIYLL